MYNKPSWLKPSTQKAFGQEIIQQLLHYGRQIMLQRTNVYLRVRRRLISRVNAGKVENQARTRLAQKLNMRLRKHFNFKYPFEVMRK
ncbi:hypothetical protein N5D49_21265 [Pseudomonas chengduensis]|nr:hypothetical protein [Pseudomonas chengduensis]MDH0625440.1 hypothetical protein [Pseudomonas chengduensis]